MVVIIIELIIAVVFIVSLIVVYREIRNLKKDKQAKKINTMNFDENSNAPDVVNFKVRDISFEEQINALSEKQRQYFNSILDYAMQKPGAEEQKLKNVICVRVNKKIILKLSIRRGVTLASFKLENELLRDYKRNTGANASKIKQRETEVYVNNEHIIEAVYAMIDLMLEQYEKEHQEAIMRRRAQQAANRALKKEINSKIEDE